MNALGARLVRWTSKYPRFGGLVLATAVLGSGVSAWAIINQGPDLQVVQNVEGTTVDKVGGHVSQTSLTNMVKNGQNAAAFKRAFNHGDDLFNIPLLATDGVGANVGAGQRFTRMPRADLAGPTEWANHTPARATGPNAFSCSGCHNQVSDDGGGEAADNVHRDADHTGKLNQMVQRQTPHTFGLGGLQRLAEEMTVDLQNIRDAGRKTAGCGKTTTAATVTRTLTSKGVAFGSLAINHAGGTMNCTEVLSPPTAGGALALSEDLVVRPFQWKGSVAFIRDFVRGAGHNELGMQGNELLGSPTVDPTSVDGDGDGVKNELLIGDVTSLAMYQAGQPRPTTRQELASLKLIPALTSAEKSAIADGSTRFDQIGCASCHVRQLVVNDVVFREPSALKAFRDAGDRFPNGRTVLSAGLDPANPIHFDITRDILENADIKAANGQALGDFRRDSKGHAVIELFGDLRRHDLGSTDAEEVDEVGTGPSVFMTENLWGAGSTPPYMHDGRATTLTEAILEHGGEAQAARAAFRALTTAQQQHVIAFINNLVLFKAAE
jgi:cytochrome c peroxidase